MYPEESIKLRPNVPASREKQARRDLAGYYAHISALDDCVGRIVKALDEAAHTYFSHPVELGIGMLLSLGNHTVAIVAVWTLGLSFGVPAGEVSLFDYFAIVPVANIVSSIPIMPMGFGVGDYAYFKIFTEIGASGALGTAVSITFRLCQLLLSLLGGLFLLAPGARVKLDDLEAEVAEAEKVGA